MGFEQAHDKIVLWTNWSGEIEQYTMKGSIYTDKDGKGRKKTQKQCLTEGELMTRVEFKFRATWSPAAHPHSLFVLEKL